MPSPPIPPRALSPAVFMPASPVPRTEESRPDPLGPFAAAAAAAAAAAVPAAAPTPLPTSTFPAFLLNLSLPAWHNTGPFAQRHSLVHCEANAAEEKCQEKGCVEMEEGGPGVRMEKSLGGASHLRAIFQAHFLVEPRVCVALAAVGGVVRQAAPRTSSGRAVTPAKRCRALMARSVRRVRRQPDRRPRARRVHYPLTVVYLNAARGICRGATRSHNSSRARSGKTHA